MRHCWIALGGNLGAVRQTLEHALSELTRPGITLIRASRLFDTTPVGDQSGQRYLNGAAELATDLAPEQLLTELHNIEAGAGRVRTRHWGPRTLDLDLLLYESQTIASPHLTVPHPAMWYRRFVLDPLVEIAPTVVHPHFGCTVRELWQRLRSRPLPVGLRGEPGGTDPVRRELDLRFGSRIAWTANPQTAAIILRRSSQPEAETRRSPQQINLPITDDGVPLATAILDAALDEPLPVD